MNFAQTALIVAVALQSTAFAFTHVTNKAVGSYAANIKSAAATRKTCLAVMETALQSKYDGDTLSELPTFETKDEYEEYLMGASSLPQGFQTGSAIGEFVPEEAPSMGSLAIKGTIIHLTDGPSDSWAACFTQNKVSSRKRVQM